MEKQPPTKPERYTTEQVIRALEATNGLVTLAARQLGCAPNTIRNYANRYPTVAQSLQEQREKFLDTAELALMSAVQKQEGWAVCFMLKTIGRNRGYVERQELNHSGEITHKGYVTKEASPDAWEDDPPTE